MRNKPLYSSDKWYRKTLVAMLNAAEKHGESDNHVTDITDTGCKDTYSTNGLCAKKYEATQDGVYIANHHMCPYDIRLQLLTSNSWIPGVQTGGNSGCFYSCTAAQSHYADFFPISVTERVKLLISLVDNETLEKVVARGNSEATINRRYSKYLRIKKAQQASKTERMKRRSAKEFRKIQRYLEGTGYVQTFKNKLAPKGTGADRFMLTIRDEFTLLLHNLDNPDVPQIIDNEFVSNNLLFDKMKKLEQEA